MKHITLVLFLLISLFVYAETYEPKDVSEIRAQYNLLVDLRNQGEISEDIFIKSTGHLKRLAEEKFDVDLEGLDLQQVVPAQKIDWLSYALYVVSVLVILAILRPLIKKFVFYFLYVINILVRFFKNNRLLVAMIHHMVLFIKRAWEPAAYVMLVFTLYFFQNEYIILLSSILLGALLSYSILSRNENYRRSRRVKITSWLLFLLWGSLAYRYNNAFIGFIAVAAFMTSLGFVFLMFPHTVAVGFRKDNPSYVLRLTGIALLISIFSWFVFYTSYFPQMAVIKEGLAVFRAGMVSLVPLVFFLGLGYISFFMYRYKMVQRIICEMLALVCGTAVLMISLFYEINSMFWIGLLFMFWELVDKYYELVYRRIGIVWAGLFLAGILAGLGYLIQSNRVVIMEILKFLVS